MKIKTDNNGYAHNLILIAFVVLVIGVAFVQINNANKSKSSKSKADATSSLNQKDKTSSDSKTIKDLDVVQVGNVPSDSTPKSTNPTPTPSTKNNSSGSGQVTPPSTPKPSPAPTPTPTPPAPTETPLSALTAVIAGLLNGNVANVTAADIDVPAAVSGTVKARPIVFAVNGETYVAFTRVNPPNFNATAQAIASSMAIIHVSGSTPLMQAHLDKLSNLVDQDSKLVGYTQSNM